MKNLIVAGCGTGVGKTIVSAICLALLRADYWKPIDCGSVQKDSDAIKNLTSSKQVIHPSAYRFDYDLSPHQAAALSCKIIDDQAMQIPETSNFLVIESVGGVLVPLNNQVTSLDLFARWPAHWVIVSKHYLGSINHTLLTVEALKQRNIPILGIVFNGMPNNETETAILKFTGLSCLARLLPEKTINQQIIQQYAHQWKKTFSI